MRQTALGARTEEITFVGGVVADWGRVASLDAFLVDLRGMSRSMVLLGSILNASYRSLLSERSDSKAIIACPAGLSKENGRSTIGKKNIGINIGLSDQLAVPDAAAFPEDRDQPSVGNTDSKGIARLSTGECFRLSQRRSSS